MTTLDIATLYQATGRAKRDSLPEYEAAAKAAIPPGDDATFTGPGPVWLHTAAQSVHFILKPQENAGTRAQTC